MYGKRRHAVNFLLVTMMDWKDKNDKHLEESVERIHITLAYIYMYTIAMCSGQQTLSSMQSTRVPGIPGTWYLVLE